MYRLMLLTDDRTLERRVHDIAARLWSPLQFSLRQASSLDEAWPLLEQDHAPQWLIVDAAVLSVPPEPELAHLHGLLPDGFCIFLHKGPQGGLCDVRLFEIDTQTLEPQLSWVLANGTRLLGRVALPQDDANAAMHRLEQAIVHGANPAQLQNASKQAAHLLYAQLPEEQTARHDETRHALELLLAYISEHRPYLKQYVYFPALCRVPADAVHSETALSALLFDRAQTLCDHCRALSLTTRNALVCAVHTYLLENIEWHRLGLSEVADVFCISRYYLSHLFKQETGRTFVQYVTYLKMRRACVLLRHSEMKINQIAHCLVYDDAEYFSRVFKKQTGQSARAYREARKGI